MKEWTKVRSKERLPFARKSDLAKLDDAFRDMTDLADELLDCIRKDEFEQDGIDCESDNDSSMEGYGNDDAIAQEMQQFMESEEESNFEDLELGGIGRIDAVKQHCDREESLKQKRQKKVRRSKQQRRLVRGDVGKPSSFDFWDFAQVTFNMFVLILVAHVLWQEVCNYDSNIWAEEEELMFMESPPLQL